MKALATLLLCAALAGAQVPPGVREDTALTGNIDFGAKAALIQIANAGTGTTVKRLAKLTGAPSTAVVAGTSDTSGIIGIVVAGAGTTGSASIARLGHATCEFDGATTAGHYVTISVTDAGKCHDAGSTYPTSGQVIGFVTETIGSAGDAPVLIRPDIQASSGGGGGGTINTGSGNGIIFPFGGPSSFSTNTAAMAANRGNRYEFCTGVQWESRDLVFSVTTQLTSGQGMLFAIRSHDLTALVAVSSVHTGTSSGAQSVTWASGSAVSGGVLTLPAGCYYLAVESDSPTMTYKAYGDGNVLAMANVGSRLAYANANTATSSGTGASVVPTANVSAVVWTGLSAGPANVALRN
jgi:hypothetical protein